MPSVVVNESNVLVGATVAEGTLRRLVPKNVINGIETVVISITETYHMYIYHIYKVYL